MPGENCSIYKCGRNRRHKGIGIFKAPGKKNPEWRARFLNQIKRSDPKFEELKKLDHVYACSRHFYKKDIIVRKYYPHFCENLFYVNRQG